MKIREQAVEVGTQTPAGVFTLWRTVLAHIAVIRGKEMETDGKRVPETVHKLTFDYYDVKGLRPDHILRWEGLTLDIKQVLPDHANKDETVVEALEISGAAPEAPGEGEQGPPANPPQSEFED